MPLLLPIIAILTVGTFLLNLSLPLGYVIWILYLIPLLLTLPPSARLSSLVSHLLGGRFEVVSSPGQGIRIIVEIPKNTTNA